MIGRTLGHYRILEKIGAGGMGEVYRARDTRLERDVAIKVLPSHLSKNSELRQRFEREAKIISHLNDPRICTLYDIGYQDGVDYLVMEYLEGETLARRLEKGPLPVDQLLQIGTEIANALDKAHRQGVIHRDLKPGNIMLTKAGTKLLDFGLAKPAQAAIGTMAERSTMATEGKPLTAQGAILGTLNYMAPEQLEAHEADARADIFALGAVLYEMATGKRAFEGNSAASVIAAILEKEPQPITHIQPLAPAMLEWVVKTCLAKNPEARWQTPHDVKLQLAWIAHARTQADSGVTVSALPQLRRRIAIVSAAALLLALASLVYTQRALRRHKSESIRAYILPPENTKFYFIGGRAGPAVISPDGKRLAFAAITADGKQMLWVRPLNSAAAQPLAGTEAGAFPFWSPDSRWLGFFAQGALKKIDAAGGPVQTLAGAPLGRGGSWAPDDTIIFAPSSSGGIYRVSASGGQPLAVTKLEDSRQERSHRWPYFLPDGRHFVFLSRLGTWESRRNAVHVASLDSPERKQVLNVDTSVIYTPPGFLLFVLKDGTLMAQPFDAGRLQNQGEAFPVAERVLQNEQVNLGLVSASTNGVLVYDPAKVMGSTLLWFDRKGKQIGSLGGRALSNSPAISPDGRRVALDILDPSSHTRDIWIYDVGRSSGTRFTFGPGDALQPVWSPDGQQIVFSCEHNGNLNLCVKPSSGTGEQKFLSSSPGEETPTSWSRDGHYIAYSRLGLTGTTRSDVWILPLLGSRKPFAFLHSPAEENDASFSPNSKWVAYVSYESGRNEIYITSFPDAASKWQVSTNGGREPRWRADGKELFYLTPDNALVALEVRTSASGLELGSPRPLSVTRPTGFRGTFDVSPDGRQFLIKTIGDEDLPPLMLVTDWSAELKK